MKASWPLIVGPALGAAGATALCVALAPGMAVAPIQAVQVCVFGLAATASIAAALSFGSGDYLRRAWLLFSSCYVMLTVDVLAFGSATALTPRALTPSQAAVSGLITLVANLGSVAGLVLVARAWRVAGLPLAVSGARLVLIEAGLAIIAAVLLGPTAWQQLSDTVGGKPDAAHELVSTLGDVASLLLVGPILLTATTLRGGLLGWTWGLIGASTLAWLFVDGTEGLASVIGLSTVVTVGLGEVLRVLATLLQVSAAVAQRRAVT